MDNASLECPVRTSDTPFQRLKIRRDIDGLSFSQIASDGEFSGIPRGTLCAIYHGAKVPKQYRPIFFPRRQAVKHICGNCAFFNRRRSYGDPDEWGTCWSAERASNQNGGVLVSSDFGCRFWKRKAGI